MEAYSGTINSSPLSVTILPLTNGDIGRVLVSIPLSSDPHSLGCMIAKSRGINSGPNASNTAVGYSMFCNIENALRANLGQTKNYGFLAAVCYSVGSHFCVRVDFAGRATKVLNGMKLIVRNMTPNRTVWRDSLRHLVDAEGKELRPSGDDFQAACSALKSAMGKIEIMITGKTVIKKTKDMTARQRVEQKVKAAADAVKDISCERATATKFSHAEGDALKNKIVKPLKSGFDFFWCDARKQVTIIGDKAVMTREISVDPSDYADKIMNKLKDKLAEFTAFQAAGLGGFTAGDLKVFMNGVKKGDITKAVA